MRSTSSPSRSGEAAWTPEPLPYAHDSLTLSSSRDSRGDSRRSSGRSPLRATRSAEYEPTAPSRGRRNLVRGSPDRRRGEEYAAPPSEWAVSPTPSQRSRGRSPTRERRYDPSPPVRGSPADSGGERSRRTSWSAHSSPQSSPAGGRASLSSSHSSSSGDTAALRSDAIAQLRRDFGRREGRHCERAWAKRALVEVGFRSMDDFGAAYSWLQENVNDLEMVEPVAPPSSFGRWLRSIGDWLEEAPSTDVMRFQAWAQERTTRPAWTVFQSETDHWGGRWEVQYWLGVELDDYIEMDEWAQFTLVALDYSGFRVASEGSDLRLQRASPLARKLKAAWLSGREPGYMGCLVTVVKTELGAERIADCEALGDEEGALPGSEAGEEPSPPSRQRRLDDEKEIGIRADAVEEAEGQSAWKAGGLRCKRRAFRGWKRVARELAEQTRRNRLVTSPVVRMKNSIMSRAFNSWAEMVRMKLVKRRVIIHLKSQDKLLKAKVWQGWYRYTTRETRRPSRGAESHRSPARERHRSVSPAAGRTTSRGKARRSSSPLPTRSLRRTSSARSPRRTPPPSSDSGSGSNDLSRRSPSKRSSGRSPSRQQRSLSRHRPASTGRGALKPEVYHPLRTKSGPMARTGSGRKRASGVDPSGRRVTSKGAMLRVPLDSDEVKWEVRQREAKREAKEAKEDKKHRDLQRKRDVSDRLARMEREVTDEKRHGRGRKEDRHLSGDEKIRRAAAAAAKRIFEENDNPHTLNFATFIHIRTQHSVGKRVRDEEYQACSEIWTRFDKDKGAVTRQTLADILAEMVYRKVISISDDGTVKADTDDKTPPRREPLPRDDRGTPPRLRRSSLQPEPEPESSRPNRSLSKRLDDASGRQELNDAADRAKQTGTLKRLADGAMEVEFVDLAKTGLMFSRRKFASGGSGAGESYFSVRGAKQHSEAERLEGLEEIKFVDMLLDKINGKTIEVDDTVAAKVEDVFIRETRPVRLTLVLKDQYTQRASDGGTQQASSSTASRPAPVTASDPSKAADKADDAPVDDPLATWESHPELKRLLQDKTLDEMAERIISFDCVTGQRTEKLPITWWPKKGEWTPLVIKAMDQSQSGHFAEKIYDNNLSECMMLRKIGAQDCDEIGYSKSMIALQAAMMPRKRTTLVFAALEPRDPAGDEPIDDVVDDVVTYVRVLEDFPEGGQATEDGDMAIRIGDFIVVTEKTDENWWRGYVDGERDTLEGVFPCGIQYVEELTEDEFRRQQRPESPTLTFEQYCRSCQVMFSTEECPGRHNSSQHLPKQMAIQQLYTYNPDKPSTTSGRATPSWPAPTSMGRATPAAQKKKASALTLNTRQKALVEKLRSNLHAHSYGTSSGQDPRSLFKKYDRNKDGAIDLREFKDAVRKGGQITARKMTDNEVRDIFQMVDTDDSGSLSVDELAEFVWGAEGSSAGEGAAIFDALRRNAESVIKTKCGFTAPDADRAPDLFRSMCSNRSSLSVSNFDAWARKERKLYNQDCVELAFKAADENNSKSIQHAEFGMLMEHLVLFTGLKQIFSSMDTNGDRRLDRREFEQAMRRLNGSTTTGAMTPDEIDRAFTAIDLDAGGSIRFSELCTWSSMMLKDALAAASQQQADDSPMSSATTPGFRWASHPQLKRLLQDKTLDDMEEKIIKVECNMGSRMVPLGITWMPKKSETDSLVVKEIQIKSPSPFSKELESVTQCMILSKINAQDCRGYTKSIEALTAALKPNRRTTLEFASLEARDESAAAVDSSQQVLEYVQALADFAGDQPGDLSFQAGDMIVVTAKDDSGWWHGYLDRDPQIEGEFRCDDDQGNPFFEPEPEPEPEPDPQYCKACKEVFETPQCKAFHDSKDLAGGANYISIQEAKKGHWPNSEVKKLARTATYSRASSGGLSASGRATPRYAGTAGPTGSTPRKPSPGKIKTNEWDPYGSGSTQRTSQAGLNRTATARGAASPPKAVTATKGSQYCKACKGTFTESKCPNNHGSYQYMPAAEATAWPGYNSVAVYGKKR